MDDMLQNLNDYNIDSVKLTYLIDLYSPYALEKFLKWTPITDEFIKNYPEKIPIVNMLNYINVKREHLK